tara:strand:+ start:740 stop:916 length:177 start_codon:yes stop_codon:yes gene_type:complete
MATITEHLSALIGEGSDGSCPDAILKVSERAGETTSACTRAFFASTSGIDFSLLLRRS